MEPGPYAAGSILHFVLDDRYTAGVFRERDEITVRMPFLGWGVQVTDGPGGPSAAVVPVFLRESDARAVTRADVETDDGTKLVRLIPAEPGGLR